jgi:hypothetical protein
VNLTAGLFLFRLFDRLIGGFLPSLGFFLGASATIASPELVASAFAFVTMALA